MGIKPPFHNHSALETPASAAPEGGCIGLDLIAAIAIGTGIFWMRSPEPAYSEPVRLAKKKSVEAAPKVTSSAVISQKSYPAQDQAESAAAVPARPIEPPPAQSTYPGRPGMTEKSRQRASIMSTAIPTPSLPPPNYNGQPVAPKLARNNSELVSVIRNLESAASTVTVSPPIVHPGEPLLGPAPPIHKPREYWMSGKWLYVARREDTKKGLYPPEYIEMRITRSAGLLKGKYHALYQVKDRPISSEVNFQFEGRPSEGVAVLPWSSSNGSRGELRLKRLSDDSLEVNWITTSFGSVNTLASGTAVLYRSDPP